MVSMLLHVNCCSNPIKMRNNIHVGDNFVPLVPNPRHSKSQLVRSQESHIRKLEDRDEGNIVASEIFAGDCVRNDEVLVKEFETICRVFDASVIASSSVMRQGSGNGVYFVHVESWVASIACSAVS